MGKAGGGSMLLRTREDTMEGEEMSEAGLVVVSARTLCHEGKWDGDMRPIFMPLGHVSDSAYARLAW